MKRRKAGGRTNLEERDEVGLGGVGDKVSNVDGRVEDGSLRDDDIVAQRSSLEVDGSRGSSSSTDSRSRGHASWSRSSSSGLSLLLHEERKAEANSALGRKRTDSRKEELTWLAQLTRMARDPSHSPFMVAMACSASVFSLKARKP